MSRNLTATFASWLESASIWTIGEILLRRIDAGFELRHHRDAERSDLESYHSPEEARRLSLYDDAGEYRPLKTAPNLRRGWRLVIKDAQGVRRALDYFYPAMLGILRDWQEGSLAATPLRETLARQSGMYAVTRKISDIQADAMIGSFCRSQDGCLKTILWKIGPETPVTSLPAEKFQPAPPDAARPYLPLLCQEACNLLVARAREVVKETAKPA